MSGKPIICHHCDTVHRREPLQAGTAARCLRCAAVLYHAKPIDLSVMLALALTGLFTFVIANLYPIVVIQAAGHRTQATLWEAVEISYDTGAGPIAVVAAATVFIFPLLQLALYGWVLIPLRAGVVPAGFVEAMHLLRLIRPWSMIEVFLIGVLVSLVKLAGLATVSTEPGLWGYAALTVIFTVLGSFDLRQLWERASELKPDAGVRQ